MEAEKLSHESLSEEQTDEQDNKREDCESSCDGLDEYFILKEELLTYIHEVEQSSTTKKVLLQRNTTAATQRPDLSDIAKQDSSVKKNSAFIKKLRNLGVIQTDQLIKECLSLNLSKYLSEVANAIVEARIKFTDIPTAVLLCTELNCKYAEFASFLQEEYIKVLTINKEEPVSNANRLRVELCFYAELSLCGVIPAKQSLPVLGTALTALTADKTFNTLSLILSFCKHCGPDFAGLVPRRIRMLSDQFGVTLTASSLLASSKQESVKNLLCDYYLSLCQHLHNEQIKISAYEKQNRQILMAKGELRPDRITNAEVMKNEIQTLLGGAVTLAELLDLELPDLPDTDLQDLLLGDGGDCSGAHVWEDEETRMFYTQLPDVKEYMGQMNKPEDSKGKVSTKDSDLFKSDDSESPSKKSALDTFLKLLPDCRNKIMIDHAALEFLIYFNSKAGRKKLIITLYTVPRSKMELLPFYARFVAILNPVVPEVATALCQQLKSEMLRHIHKKDQVNIESKKKTVKFVGELVNFSLYTKKEALRAVKLLLYDFTHHNVEMACSLLETCGCVLYAASDTHLSTKYYLDQMMRLKTVMTLDSRYINLIENTYYHILPPETNSLPPTAHLTTMQKFIQKVIYQDLSQPGSDTAVCTLLRSLNWDCKDTLAFTVMCLTDAANISYLRIRALAGILAMLADYQGDAVCRVVDGVLEDIRLGMEINDFTFNQRRVAMIKYLGELYNYRLLDSTDILKVLYSLISFGAGSESDGSLAVDPPNNVIRIHLVLLLLSTCAFPLSSLETTNKLKYFFTYFQNYYWCKKSSSVWTEDQPFPTDIVYRFEDTLLTMYPDFVLAANFQEANNAVNTLNTKMYCEIAQDNPNISSFLGTVFEDDESNDDDDDDGGGGNSETLTNTSREIPPSRSPTRPNQIKKKDEQDEEFIQELSKMFSESVKATESSNIKPNIDIAVPLTYKKVIEDDKPQFVLMVKKGNKQTFKTVTLPPDHDFIISLKSREEAFRQDKEQLKKITLDINERQQEEF